MQASTKSREEMQKASYTRIDASERVKGIAKYTGDWHEKEMLYARIVMSTVPHGIVREIDRSEAMKVPGVKDIVTCFEDSTIWHSGEREKERRVFADHVRFIGDCIGAVTATTRMSASLGAQAMSVRYDEKPSSFNIDDSLNNGNVRIWEAGNTIGPIRYGYGDPDEVFSKSPVVLERHYSTSRVHNAPLEPAISLAWWNDDRLTVVAATQSVHGCRNGIATDLGIPRENVRVIGYYKGGGFGNKISSMNYDLIASICSRRTGRPVMVEYSREEEFKNVHGRWSSDQDLRIAADSSGKIKAVQVLARCDIGSYTRHVKQGNFIQGPEHYYSTEAWKAEIYGIYTNTPATGHMRAPPGPQSAFAAETLVDELAYELHMDPLEISLRNYIRNPVSGKFTSNGFEKCIREGSREFQWKHRWHEPELRHGRTGIATGVGMSIASWHSGIGYGEAIVTVHRNGEATVNTGVVDIGTGAKTTMAIIASRSLGIPMKSIHTVWGDTSTSPYSVGESGSRTTNFTGWAVREASLQIRSAILGIASEKYGIPSEKLNISDGKVVNTENNGAISSISTIMSESGLDQIERKVESEPHLGEGEERYVFAAHFAEVAVDLETGEIKLTDYLAAHDSGEILNRLTAESQVEGGIVMAAGMALSEKLIISQTNGSIENPSFLQYRIPRISDIPRIRTIFVDTVDPYGPKSLGEISIIPAPAAIGNAVFNATGVRLRSLPLSREELLMKLSQ